jgi:hypothetical protein
MKISTDESIPPDTVYHKVINKQLKINTFSMQTASSHSAYPYEKGQHFAGLFYSNIYK